MDPEEAELIVKTQTVRCGRCNGTGIYRWGVVVNGVPSRQGVCYGCWGGKRFPASRRHILAGERALGLRPPAKPRKPKAVPQPVAPAEPEPFDWSNYDVPF